ncbi:TAXI family TRAP transporter solute-binding subunit [Helicobacter muridarum]|uniref:Aliphatic sulfonates-binding protein n=1 Tax=Helicobacter muridarum TaxID=216 RepID=A0A099TYU0_9HELI|nr:TAXI family TRAP transporter solute-binding subunit [Helicobacter muridarum]TLE00203.1 TAXI family TRAP transporter solute-binding subunit [Helicobacter muridarum]STQ85687.1 Putative aliphatic sulfonates-binding protein precursor [Helicobacter muridarum]
MLNKLYKSVFIIFFISFFLSCSEDKSKNKQSLDKEKTLDTKLVTIATGGAAGPYNIIGTSLAELYSKELGINSKTQTTGASIENLNLLEQKKVEMAFVMSDALNDAINGIGAFPKPLENISQIAVLYPNFIQIITSKKSGIKSIEDLKGKRVAVGDRGSGVENNARFLLSEFGINYDDIKPDYLGYAAAADALQNGRIDAAFLTSGLPNASILQLEKSFDLALVSIPTQRANEIASIKDYFVALEIPAHTYGNEEPVPTIAIRNALVVRKDLSEEDVRKLTKTFFDNLDKLELSHRAVKDIPSPNKDNGMVAPIHNGALKALESR